MGSASARTPGSRAQHARKTLLAGGIAVVAASALVASPAHAGRAGNAQLAAVATAAELSGQLLSVTPSALVVRSVSGHYDQQSTVTQTIGTTAATHYYQVRTAPAQVLAVGEMVALSPSFGNTKMAASVTVIAANGPITYVQQGGGPGGPDGAGGPPVGGPPPGSGSPPGGGTPPAGGHGGPDDATTPSLNVAGTITARSATALSVRTAQGKTTTLTIAAATKYYRLIQVARAQLRTQAPVSMSARLVNGQVTARDVVMTPTGTTATIVTPGKAIL